MTFAEAGVGPKSDLSHRARAMEAIRPQAARVPAAMDRTVSWERKNCALFWRRPTGGTNCRLRRFFPPHGLRRAHRCALALLRGRLELTRAAVPPENWCSCLSSPACGWQPRCSSRCCCTRLPPMPRRRTSLSWWGCGRWRQTAQAIWAAWSKHQGLRTVFQAVLQDVLKHPVLGHEGLTAAIGPKYLVAWFKCADDIACISQLLAPTLKSGYDTAITGDYTVTETGFKIHLVTFKITDHKICRKESRSRPPPRVARKRATGAARPSASSRTPGFASAVTSRARRARSMAIRVCSIPISRPSR